MNSTQISSIRKDKDISKLLISGYDVIINCKSNTKELQVVFKGPSNSLYENGYWKVLVTLPEDYPYKSPSIGFTNRIYHPNIDEKSGSVCLDVINQTWSPMYELINIFDTFLPQLLLYPNPSDPLNPDAAKLLNDNPEKYKNYVLNHVKLNASSKIYLIKKPDNLKKKLFDLKNSYNNIDKNIDNTNYNFKNKTLNIALNNNRDGYSSELSNASFENNELNKELDEW